MSALLHCYETHIYDGLGEDLDGFLYALGMLIEKYRAGAATPQLTAGELRERFGVSELTLAKVLRLLQASSVCAGSSYQSPEAGSPLVWTVTAAQNIRQYRNVKTIGEYVAVREKFLAGLTRSAAPSLPSAESPSVPPTPVPNASATHPAITSLSNPPSLAAGRHREASDHFAYDVAISFAGPQRNMAKYLADAATEAGFRVFYDDYFAADLWGKDLACHFQQVFSEASRFCVLLVSHDYLDRIWTTLELRYATDRLLHDRGAEYLLQVKVDPIDLPGIPSTIGYVSLSNYSIEQTSVLLVEKLRSIQASLNEVDVEAEQEIDE